MQICSAIYSVIFLLRNTFNKSVEGSRKFSSASKADDIHVQYLKAYISHSDSKNICLLINRIQYRETKRRFLLNIITTSKINMASVTVNLIKTTNKYFSVFRISCALKKDDSKFFTQEVCNCNKIAFAILISILLYE